ncbi:hypothetical protein TGPRC2_365140, partial [Toxoplasma gondii TgCatPRC2]
ALVCEFARSLTGHEHAEGDVDGKLPASDAEAERYDLVTCARDHVPGTGETTQERQTACERYADPPPEAVGWTAVESLAMKPAASSVLLTALRQVSSRELVPESETGVYTGIGAGRGPPKSSTQRAMEAKTESPTTGRRENYRDEKRQTDEKGK